MSVNFRIAIAEKNVDITATYKTVYDLCKDYLTNDPCDFGIEVGEDDISYERDKEIQEANVSGLVKPNYPDSYLETLAIYRKIALSMLEFDTLLFHGSAIAVDSVAYLFTAKSGTGKSTHTKLWMEHFGNRAVMINDDKPMLKITNNGVFVCGTPWDGKHRLSSNITVPLKAIVILERGTMNSISRIDKRTAFPMLYQQSFHPKDPDKLTCVMALVNKLGSNVKLYNLKCNMTPEAALVSYNGMNEEDE